MGSRPARILVVDDERSVRRAVMGFLEDEGHRTIGSGSGSEAIETLENEKADLVLLDVWMEKMDGLETLERIRKRWPEIPVLMMSGHGSIDVAVRATRKGAYDFLEKPLSPERLAITVSRALDHQTSLRAQAALREELGAGHALIGESEAMTTLLADVARVSKSDGRVLIVGENGTGKELVSRAIHENSARRGGPFVRLNSAAIPRDLVESELFGFEKGAFTGATQRKLGKLELADRGTLFLDEVGDMDTAAQAKLLRALETGEVERLGGTHAVAFDVRVIAATNKDLKAEIGAGRFREDLYYRLAVVPIAVPPLRVRDGDVQLLAEHFLRHFCQEAARPPKRFSPHALEVLKRYRWPGNVRELRNLCERLSIMVDAEEIESDVLEPLLEPVASAGEAGPAARSGADDATKGLRVRMESAEREILVDALENAGWNVTEAARRLGIDRASLHRKIRRHEITKSRGGHDVS